MLLVQSRPGAPRRRSLRATLLCWASLRRQRNTLDQLDGKMLDDIGVSPEQAMKEARRPFWDAPGHWSR